MAFFDMANNRAEYPNQKYLATKLPPPYLFMARDAQKRILNGMLMRHVTETPLNIMTSSNI
jgi:hypothetical protein